MAEDTLAERLRRRPAKPMGSLRVGSNPTGVDCCVCDQKHSKSSRVPVFCGALCVERRAPCVERPMPMQPARGVRPQQAVCWCLARSPGFPGEGMTWAPAHICKSKPGDLQNMWPDDLRACPTKRKTRLSGAQ